MSTDMTLLGSNPMPENRRQTWVQTERSAHEAWADLINTNAKAAALLHKLVSHMDQQAAVVVSRAALAAMLNCSEATVKRSVAALKADKWIEVVQLGGKGGVNAYIINSRVAWADSRSKLPAAVFTATVLASRAEQLEIESAPLRRIPTLYPGERQLPTGESTRQFELEAIDLPAVNKDKP